MTQGNDQGYDARLLDQAHKMPLLYGAMKSLSHQWTHLKGSNYDQKRMKLLSEKHEDPQQWRLLAGHLPVASIWNQSFLMALIPGAL
jgi:hypothetical protein